MYDQDRFPGSDSMPPVIRNGWLRVGLLVAVIGIPIIGFAVWGSFGG